MQYPRFLYLLLLIFVTTATPALAQNQPEPLACRPLLTNLLRHRIAPGETVESIAQGYGLLPETLLRLNPVLQNDPLPIGEEILVPPFNGVRLEVPPGTTWQDLEVAYGVRADVLFELNGCQTQPQVVFIPGVSWSSQNGQTVDPYTGLTRYPLPTTATVALPYGWYINPQTEQRLFHSGIDLLASPGTSVVAVERGVVVYAGYQENYGNLVVINHPGGRQSRYAHLETIQINTGQTVQPGDAIATVGTTGNRDSSPPHLHFEVRYYTPQGWIAQDPEIHLTTAASQ